MSNIPNALQKLIAELETQRAAEIEAKKQTIMREKVVPYNAEVDQQLRLAIESERKLADEEIALRRKQLEEQISQIQQMAQKKKEEHMQSELSVAASLVDAEYSATIQRLTDMKKELGE